MSVTHQFFILYFFSIAGRTLSSKLQNADVSFTFIHICHGACSGPKSSAVAKGIVEDTITPPDLLDEASEKAAKSERFKKKCARLIQ